MLEFISNNLDIILDLIYLIIGFFAICFSYYFNLKSKLAAHVNEAINNAEDLEATGEEKMEAAINHVMNYVPAAVKPFMSKDVIRILIQNSFDIIEAYAKKQNKEEK